MHYKFYLSPLVIGFIFTVSKPIAAAEAIALHRASLPVFHQQFGLSSAVAEQAFKVVSVHQDQHQIHHMRLQQQYYGYPVFGGYAILHSKNPRSSLQLTTDAGFVNGKVYRGLSKELGQPQPTFAQKGQHVLQQFKKGYAHAALSDEQVLPMVYIDAQQHAHWAYKVSFLAQPEQAIPERPTAIIEATTGNILVQWNGIKTARTLVKGYGQGGNEKSGEISYGVTRPPLAISRDDFQGMCYMENADVRVVDMGFQYKAINAPMEFECPQEITPGQNSYWTGYEEDGYDKINGAYSPSNDAMYVGTMIHAMYRDWYALEPLHNGNKPMQLLMRVHYGKFYENAFWDGRQMTFGDGDLLTYPLVSLAIGAHEISHGFTEQHSNLEYFGQSGGMNEAFSDMAAQTAEYYAFGKSSWTIGADILKKNSGYPALRYMDKPSRDGYSIDTADDYRPGLDVHYASGVYNRLFYLLAHQPGWTPRQAFDVMLKANIDYWTPYSTFEEGACGVVYAAEDLELATDGIKQALSKVAIDHEACG